MPSAPSVTANALVTHSCVVDGTTSGGTTGSSQSSNGSQTPGIARKPTTVDPSASTPTGTSIDLAPSPWWSPSSCSVTVEAGSPWKTRK